MTTPQALDYISEQLNIYWGLFMFIFGIIGSIWNILIFRHYSLRSSSCCTYMLIGSIASLIQIIFSLSDRIIDEGFQIHWTENNIVWCKLRVYIAQCASLTPLTCLVFSVIDRFFSTCRQIKWRHLNSIHTARQICLFIILFWMFVSIPTLVYFKPMEINSDHRLCINSSIIWSKILTYFFSLCCYGIFPWFFMSLFGFLSRKNIRHIHSCRVGPVPSIILTRMARIDGQLGSMLFLQIIICILSSIPFCIQNLYQNLSQTIEKSEYRQSQENLFLQITRLTFYLNYVSAFYINYLSSEIFRETSKQVFINLFKKQENCSRQITVINHQEYNNQIQKRRFKVFTIYPVTTISPA